MTTDEVSDCSELHETRQETEHEEDVTLLRAAVSSWTAGSLPVCQRCIQRAETAS